MHHAIFVAAVADKRLPIAIRLGCASAATTFAVSERWRAVQARQGNTEHNQLYGPSRLSGIVFVPDQKIGKQTWLLVPAKGSGALVVVNRRARSGCHKPLKG